MQMEPTLPPEENQDKIEPTGEDHPNSSAQEEVNDDSSREEKAKTKTKPAPNKILEIAVGQLSLEDFPAALEKVLKNDQWMRLGTLVRDLQQSFEAQFLILLQEKKAEFIAEGGNEIDFYFVPEYKKKFSNLLKEYKQKKGKHFKEIEASQKANLNRKKKSLKRLSF